MFRYSSRQILQRIKNGLKGAKSPPVTPPNGICMDPRIDANRNLTISSQHALNMFLSSGARLQLGSHGKGDLVSLVVVVFNKAHLTYACLRSISLLQHTNLEILIVNNNSTDQTSSLLKQLDGRITILDQTENIHFLRGCNRAFAHINYKSQYVGLVNNDALLDPTTITQALRVFDRWPDTGIVGGQILHLDGQLQEAGSVICRDGSCRGLGRRQSPWQPLVQTRRKVDYVSGFFFLIDADLLKEIGGFDISFAPAYYEETDLCVESWKRGRSVVYEPSCLVHHVEFASSGQGYSDAAHLMSANQLRFYSKHMDWLSHQAHSEHFRDLPAINQALRQQAYQVRLLWIDDKHPDAALGAGFSRLSSIISVLADLGCFVTVFATDLLEDGIGSNPPTPILHAKSADYELHWGGEGTLRKLLQERLGFYTHIVASRRHNHELLRDWLAKSKSSAKRPKVIADVESIFSIREKSHDHLQKTGTIAKMEDIKNDLKLDEELSSLDAFDQLWSVSQPEADLIQCHCAKDVHVVSHAFPIITEFPSYHETAGMVFMGAMNHPGLPNLDSLSWLADAIIPALREQHPRLHEIPLTVIGPFRKDLIQPLLERIQAIWPVIHLGQVPEVETVIRRHRVMLAPTRFAAGLPHKVQQSIAVGIPVVTTELIASQMCWADGEGFVASNNAHEFAHLIATLYNNPTFWKSVQMSGLARINRDCCPQRQVDALAHCLKIGDWPEHD